MLSNYVFFLAAGEDIAVLEPEKQHFEKTFLVSICQSYQAAPCVRASK